MLDEYTSPLGHRFILHIFKDTLRVQQAGRHRTKFLTPTEDDGAFVGSRFLIVKPTRSVFVVKKKVFGARASQMTRGERSGREKCTSACW